MGQINQLNQENTTHDVYRSDGHGWELDVTYSGSDPITMIRTAENGDTFTRTITYTGGLVTNVTPWIKN
jgi:hypothetical protein